MDLFRAAKPTVLVVDDTPANLGLMAELLKSAYTVKAVNNGVRALALAELEPPDLILLDVMMPEMDGYEVCRLLKARPNTRQIPVIFLTSRGEVEDEQHGLALGAVDYITRPINPPILLSRVRAHVADASSAKTMRVNNEYLEFEVVKRTRQLAALQDVTILALASLAEKRDADTGNHLRRTQHYMRALSKHLKPNSRFNDFLTNEMVELLFKCAPLHDIGKVGIPDRILLKPGRYEPDEFEIMKTHPALGRDAPSPCGRDLRRNVGLSGNRQGYRLLTSRKMGWIWLPLGVDRRRHSHPCTPDGACRCLRRAHQPASLQGGDVARTGCRHHHAGKRHAFRSRHG